jgi:hypothetical protein
MDQKSYTLSDQTIPSIAFSYHLEDIEEFQRIVNSLGIRTHNTRIDRYRQYLQALLNEDKKAETQIFKGLEEQPFNGSSSDRILGSMSNRVGSRISACHIGNKPY